MKKFKYFIFVLLAITATIAFAAATDKYISSQGNIVIKTAASKTVGIQDSLYTKQTGEVGIGSVSSSGWDTNFKALEFGSQSGGAIGTYTNTDTYIMSNAYYNGGWKYRRAGGAGHLRLSSDNRGQLLFKNATTGSAGGAITWVDAFSVDNVGKMEQKSTVPSAFGGITSWNTETTGESGFEAKDYNGSSQSRFGWDSANGNHIWTTNPGTTFKMGINNAPYLTMGSTGKVDFTTGIGFGAGASTLSNYTVSTWTPVISCNAGTFNSQSAEGYYVRVGNGVFIFGKVYWTSVTGLSGNTYINMPVDPIGSTTYSYPLQIFSNAGYASPISLMSASGDSQFYIYNTSLAAIACSSFNSSGTIIFSGWIGQ
jgi:hypothetical protein